MDWTSTLPEPVSKTYNSYNVSQKQIAIFAASKYGIEAVSSTFGFHRSLIWRWKQKTSYVSNADASLPPADSVPARPVQELCGLRPEERNLEENRLVFQLLGEDPDACLSATGIVSPPDLVNQLDADDNDDDDDDVQRWKDALNRVATEDNQLQHQYSSQSLKIALESGIPDDVKDQVEQCMNAALEHNNNYRSNRTSTAWKPKQRSFLSFWHNLLKNTDIVLVSEAKLVLWLHAILKTNPQMGLENLQQHVSAVIDLWRDQNARGLVVGENPRKGAALKGLLRRHKRGKEDRKKFLSIDKGIGTLADGYRQADVLRIANYFFEQGSLLGLRSRLDFLLGHAMLCRSEDKRNALLANLCMYELEDEGPTDAMPLCST